MVFSGWIFISTLLHHSKNKNTDYTISLENIPFILKADHASIIFHNILQILAILLFHIIRLHDSYIPSKAGKPAKELSTYRNHCFYFKMFLIQRNNPCVYTELIYNTQVISAIQLLYLFHCAYLTASITTFLPTIFLHNHSHFERS